MKLVNTPSGQAYFDRLKIAFDLVADPKDWRAPIYAVVLVEARDAVNVTVDEISAAITHYTATVPQVHVLSSPSGALLFKAAGYREGPAGP